MTEGIKPRLFYKSLEEKTYDPRRAFEAIKQVKNMEMERTVRPLARLMAYNGLEDASGRDGEKRAAERIAAIDINEKKYKENRYLPTEGVEIECHRDFLDRNLIETLNKLEINNREEEGYGDVRLWEVSPRFSYSPRVQSRYLEELVKLGAVPIDLDGKVDINYVHSLHINFGIPAEIYSAFSLNSASQTDSRYGIKEFYEKNLVNCSDVLSYAFTSTERVMNMKRQGMNDPLLVKGDDATMRSLKTGELSRQMSFNYNRPLRLEFRSGEFRDLPTFRLLSEAQNLTAMLFAYIKEGEGKVDGSDEKEVDLRILWERFEEEYEKILAGHGITDKNLIAENPDRLIKLMESTNIKKDCRSLIAAYSKKVIRLLGLGYESAAKEQGK